MKIIKEQEDQLYLLDHRLEHKGYIGEVIYDGYTNRFHGSVINTYPYSIADAEAPDIESLPKEFAISIDIYLEACEEDGDPPIPPGEIVDYDALHEQFVKDHPDWLEKLLAKLDAADDDEDPTPTPIPQNGAYQAETETAPRP